MDGVIKKKRKSFFARIFGKIKSNPSECENEGIALDVPLGDVRIDDDEMAAIKARRNELRAARHGHSDAVVTFDGND